ncbi:TIGR01244 family sulfur transferase [Rhodobium gokarnense]|uniref:Uncharacterized protein (TIGR01244 family) n=1 Tax=Rhodobium gokarnense TaxID=364296 RepID=A0ABT3HBF6_9HYPH|nr:TIGR01244 family sulfur transferase [Rhodobium gokarnense]MCW2307621.1 uncharacterized protein (TIGR01244 family) [Rhodobium gokarnense]
MAKFTALTPQISVSPELSETDIARAAAMGFRTILCNRPDDEPGVAFSSEAARHTAGVFGMAFHHVPVAGYEITEPDAIDAVADVLSGAVGPVLMYCKSGMRSAYLWALGAVGETGLAETLQIMERAGIDASIVEDELIERAAMAPAAADAAAYAAAV